MRRCILRTVPIVCLSALCVLLMASCGSRGGTGVPGSVTVELADGTEVRTTQGSGVIALADTEWDFYAVAPAGQSNPAPFVRLAFNSEGALRQFKNNTIANEIFGSTIRFDGQRHSTNQFGLEYTAATYGAGEPESESGFAFEGRLTAFAGGFVEAAKVTASATGSFDADDINVMRGTFSYSSRILVGSIPGGNQNETFDFIGYRVTE